MLERFSDNRILRTGVAFGLSAPLILGHGDIPGPDSESAAHYEAVPQSVINQTEQLFAETWDPANAEMSPQQQMAEKLAVAEELGLTIYDYQTEYADLIENAYGENPEVIPMTEYWERVSEFFDRYGITLVTAETEGSDQLWVPIEGATQIPLEQFLKQDSPEAKQALMAYMRSIGQFPVELVHEMGLKQVILTYLPEGTVDKGANQEAGDASGIADTLHPELGNVYVDPYKPAEGVIGHEMSHIWDALVGGLYNDPEFAKLSPGLLYENHEGYVTLALGAEGRVDRTIHDLQEAVEHAGSDEEIRQAQAALDAYLAKVVVARQYGFSNIAEDKATILEYLFSDYSRRMIEATGSPVLQRKALLLMARLMADNPALVEYFARTSKVTTAEYNPLELTEKIISPADIPTKFLNSPDTA